MSNSDELNRDKHYQIEARTKEIATTNVTSCEIVIEHEQIENNMSANVDPLLLQ